MCKERLLICIVVLHTILFIPGCAFTCIRSEKIEEPPEPYSATRLSASLLIDGFRSVPISYRPSTPMQLLILPLFLVDGLVSVVPDTALLPYDFYHRRRLLDDREFWDRFFEGGGNLPTVAEMHRHHTIYSQRTVARRVRVEFLGGNALHGHARVMAGGTCKTPGPNAGQEPSWASPGTLVGPLTGRIGEGATEGGTGCEPNCGLCQLAQSVASHSVWQPPAMPDVGDPNVLAGDGSDATKHVVESVVGSQRRHHARLDRLIDAEIALGAIAGCADITQHQIGRLARYACRQRTVRLALLRNPGTSRELIERLLREPGREELRALARNPHIPSVWAHRIAVGKDKEAALLLADNPELSESALSELDARDEWCVRRALACRTDLPDSYAYRYVQDPLLAVRILQHGRADLPAEVLLRAMDSVPEGGSRLREEVLNAMPRQRKVPRHILTRAWEERALTPRDVLLRPNLPQYSLDAMASAVTHVRELDSETIEALVPRVGASALLDLRKYIVTQRAQAGKDGNYDRDTKCRGLLSAIDNQIGKLKAQAGSPTGK